MPLSLAYWKCPHCLDDQEVELRTHIDIDIYLLCNACDKSVSAKLVNGGIKIVATTPDGDIVEVIGNGRSEVGFALSRIKPLKSDTFGSGVNPYCYSRELNFHHVT